MSKISEVVYLVLDHIKATNDDSLYNESHIIYQINNYRAFLLRQKYSDPRKNISNSNYQTICLDLEVAETICGEDEDFYLRSKQEIPNIMEIGSTKVHTCNFFIGDISYISRDRMKYAGLGKYSKNTIYGTIGPDNHLYLKSNNSQFTYLEKVQVTAIFEDINAIDDGSSCDIMDVKIPIETELIPTLIDLLIKEFLTYRTQSEDKSNDANDDATDKPVYSGYPQQTIQQQPQTSKRAKK